MHLFCLCQFPFIFTNIMINLCGKKVSFFVIVVFENCVSLTGRPILNANSFCWNITVFYFSYLSSTDINTIENCVHPLHIINRNQDFLFFFTETILYSQLKDQLEERLLEYICKIKEWENLECWMY